MTDTDDDIVISRKLRGNKRNYNRAAIAQIYGDGTVRIQQPGSPVEPVDVVLLTPAQIKWIVGYWEEVMSARMAKD